MTGPARRNREGLEGNYPVLLFVGQSVKNISPIVCGYMWDRSSVGQEI